MPASTNRSPSSPSRPDPVPLRPLEGQLSAIANLPRPLTSFIGRQREVASIVDLLRREDIRLLTLTGPGGVGKTRLAIQVAEAVVNEFPAGVWFVPLAPVLDPSLVATTVADILGVQESPTRTVEQGIQEFLRARRALLVLDNFEHLLEAGPLLARLLSACPMLTMLITSRAVLRISGEHDVAVQPLSLPSRDVERSRRREADGSLLDLSPDRLLDSSEAMRLFVARAQAARADFAVNETNAPIIAEICRRLDGLPLAIELASARVNHLPLPTLLRRLEPRLPLLTAGARDVPARLRTMRNAIAWSYDLLDAEEQELFRRLAVFVGGVTLEAAEWIAGSGLQVAGTAGDGLSAGPQPPTQHPPPTTLEGIASLTDKSLLRQDVGADGEPRYLMLETVREFGLEQLAVTGEEHETRARHAGYFLRLSTIQGEGIQIQWSLAAVQRVAAERDNVRLALAWCDEHEEFDALLQLSTMLCVTWTSTYQEGWSRVERALERTRDVVSPAHVRALNGAGILALFQGDYTRAAGYFAEELALARALADAYLTGEALVNMGLLSYRRGECAQAEVQLDEALSTLHGPAKTDPAAVLHMVRALLILGDTALVQEQFDRAAARYSEALARAPEAGMDWGMSDIQAGLGGASYCRGNMGRAAALYAESLTRAQHALAAESLARVQDRSYTPLVLSALLGLAGMAAETGQPEQGARLFGAAEAITASHGIAIFPRDRPVRERSLSALRRVLGEERLAAAQQPGHSLTIAQAVAKAVALLEAIAALLPQAASPSTTTRVANHGLTPRELEILRLVAAGRSNREIAEALFISVPTVKRHLTNIMGKLGLPSRSALNTYAHTYGLV
ncbi:MAG: LuxR C-terminal-related transcriptional regulator [Thermomicrobiales bacterium]